MSQAGSPWDVEPGRQVAALGLAVTLTVVAVDVLLVGRLSLFFDLCFVALCLALAARVRRGDFFLVALLPPLLMLASFVLLAAVSRAAIADPDDNFVQAVVTGLAHHSAALLGANTVCLGWLAWRVRSEASATMADLVNN